MNASEPIDVLTSRPAVQHSLSWDVCSFGDIVNQDLDDLADRVNTAVRHCADLSRSKPALCSTDTQRDVLHLQARIEGISRQIDDAKRTLHRMRQRAAASRPQKPPVRQPLI